MIPFQLPLLYPKDIILYISIQLCDIWNVRIVLNKMVDDDIFKVCERRKQSQTENSSSRIEEQNSQHDFHLNKKDRFTMVITS